MNKLFSVRASFSHRPIRWVACSVIFALVVGLGAGYLLGRPHLKPTDRVAPRAEHSQEDLRTEVVFRVKTDRKRVALTFDDGPDPTWTPRVLAILEKYHAKATFFQIGSAAKAHPELTKQLVDAGMQIGVHEWEHRDVTGQEYDDYAQRLSASLDAIHAAGAPSVTVMRPPYGRLDSPALYENAKHHLQTIMWSLHLPNGDSVKTARADLNKLTPGAIVLCHDGRTQPDEDLMKGIEAFISGAQDRGYELVTVEQLLADGTSHD